MRVTTANIIRKSSKRYGRRPVHAFGFKIDMISSFISSGVLKVNSSPSVRRKLRIPWQLIEFAHQASTRQIRFCKAQHQMVELEKKDKQLIIN